MNILQITSDWKWTGPAEPMLRLALGLREKGHQVALACPEPPDVNQRSLAGEARAAGLEPSLILEQGREASLLTQGGDVRSVRQLIRERDIECVHAWHTRDHLLALRARRGSRACLVRSYREAERIPAWPWNRWLFGPGCDGLLCVSPGTAERNARLRSGRPVAGVFGAVDHGLYQPADPDPRVRESLGLKPEQHVVGIVARVQRHRRFELLLEAAKRWFAQDPAARLLVVGRGTHRREVAEEPARKLGIADRVIFAGYRDQDFVDVLRSMDVMTLLVPGSDGTCRAVLEAAACGIPAVVTRRGALPELVADAQTGLVVDEHPTALAQAWQDLFASAGRRAELGAAASARARQLFTPERFAAAADSLYGAACAHRDAA